MDWQFESDKYNRRKHQRFRIDLKANYAVTRPKNGEGEGVINNVSDGGLGLNLCDNLNKNAYLVVELVLQELNTSVTVGGKVIWSKNYKDFASCGIKVDWISDRGAYTEYIKRLEDSADID